MDKVKIGPSGIGGVNEAEDNLEYFKKNGLNAAEIAFTYNIYMNKEQAIKIGKKAKQLGIDLSIHGQYFINLASKEEKKIEASKKRILKALEIGHYLGAKYVAVHAGFYLGRDVKDVYDIIKENVLEIIKTVKKNKWTCQLAPETTGKKTQFGTLDELIKLSKETGCHLCIDFAHIYARNNGRINYDEIFEKLKKFKHIYAQFSGIEYSEKGERRHLITEEKMIKELLKSIIKHKANITMINESPDPFGDAVKTRKILEKLE